MVKRGCKASIGLNDILEWCLGALGNRESCGLGLAEILLAFGHQPKLGIQLFRCVSDFGIGTHGGHCAITRADKAGDVHETAGSSAACGSLASPFLAAQLRRCLPNALAQRALRNGEFLIGQVASSAQQVVLRAQCAELGLQCSVACDAEILPRPLNVGLPLSLSLLAQGDSLRPDALRRCLMALLHGICTPSI
ncbi:hypothetical protein D9M69_345320 [compost metagenome]